MKNAQELILRLQKLRKEMADIFMDEAYREIEEHGEFSAGDFTLGDAITGIDCTIRGIKSVQEFEKGRSFYRRGNRIFARNRASVGRRFSREFRSGYTEERRMAGFDEYRNIDEGI